MAAGSLPSRALLAALGALSAGCAAPGLELPPPGAASSKGWELYSWPAPGPDGWEFALLAGTNRLKTGAEIQAQAGVLPGVGDLDRALTRLAPGERVFWHGSRTPANAQAQAAIRLPPEPVVEAVRSLARRRGLRIELVHFDPAETGPAGEGR